MRKKRKKPSILPNLLPVIAVGLLLPLGAYAVWNGGAFFAETGERAAVISAALNMPEGGIELLEERFRAQLYLPLQEDDTHILPLPETPLPLIPPDNSSSASESQQSSKPENRVSAPKIPAEYKAKLISENFSGGGSSALVNFGAGSIKNDTKHTDEGVAEILEKPLDLKLSEDVGPQVLILHTHATESFERYDTNVYDTRNTWRSRDNNSNMVAVGAAMTDALEDHGIVVIHDTTQHDYPSYNGSYERSAETIKRYIAEYPSIRVVLDLHRDAMERENQTIVKPVAVIDGKQAAQIMIISACDDGSMNIPNYYNNLRFAAAFQDYMESSYPQLTRPVFFTYRKYNMDLSPGSLLLEFGSNANTLEEAVYSATLAGEALAELLLDQTAEEKENAD